MSVFSSYSNSTCIFKIPQYSANTNQQYPTGYSEVSVKALITLTISKSISTTNPLPYTSFDGVGDVKEMFKINGRFTQKVPEIVLNSSECIVKLNNFKPPKEGRLIYSLKAPSAFYREEDVLGLSFYGDLMIL